MDEYMGHPHEYWSELDKRATLGNLDKDMLEEIVALQGKVAYYENRILQMAKVAKKEQEDD